MADVKISGLPSSTTPLAGTEVLPIVQSGATKKVAVSDLTAGRNVSVSRVIATAGLGTPSSNAQFGWVASQGAVIAGIGTSYDVLLQNKTNQSVLGVVTGTRNVEMTAGNLLFSSGKGIDFSATAGTGTSELFDDYEEGTWTPVLTFATAGDLSVTYSSQIGTYVKIGRAVILTCRLVASAFTHTTASGALRVTGIPFSGASRHWSAILFNGINKENYTTVSVNCDTGSSVLTFSASGMGQGQSSVAVADVPTGGTPFIQFTLCYETDS
jgi:hypothetical protein